MLFQRLDLLACVYLSNCGLSASQPQTNQGICKAKYEHSLYKFKQHSQALYSVTVTYMLLFPKSGLSTLQLQTFVAFLGICDKNLLVYKNDIAFV